jgi:transposase InsO family protein
LTLITTVFSQRNSRWFEAAPRRATPKGQILHQLHSTASNEGLLHLLQPRSPRSWHTDITYLPTAEGWLYLATTIDLFNREVIGHAMATHMRAELVSDAVELACRRGLVRPNAIFHSDRGSQYGSKSFRTTLARHDMRPSMGRTGSCFDNAVAESFFASLKAEIGTRVFATRAQARREVFAYINYYNNKRLHSTVKHQTPREARVCYRPPIAPAA